MATYIILSRLDHDALDQPDDLKKVAEDVATQIKKECPGVKWKDSYAVLGRFDVVDIVEADDPKQVERAALIIRSRGHAQTETMLATPWDEFKAAFGG